MEDTPLHIKQLQLKVWLAKTPAQRLKQFLEDNDALQKFWAKNKNAKATIDNQLKDKPVINR
ncbi:hypothetical protein [Ferruginibacter sp.]